MARTIARAIVAAQRLLRSWRSAEIAAALLLAGAAVLWGTEAAPPLPAQPVMGEEPAPLADPPATETSQRTVMEEEPTPAPAPDALAELPEASAVAVAPPADRAAWQKFALLGPVPTGQPMIALIIDDMGLDRRRSQRILDLPGPLTISFMSYANDLNRQAEEARRHGHELMMHVPMEPLGDSMDPGPGALLDNLPPAEIHRRVAEDLDRFSGYVGINNHMGSKFTANVPGMQTVMEELHRRGLLFIDSLTTERSVGLAVARRAGVPAAGRNVFLDNEADLAAITFQLTKLEELARRRGNAIAIGHPRDATIMALAAWLPTLAAKGFILVPVTAVVRARQPVTTSAVH